MCNYAKNCTETLHPLFLDYQRGCQKSIAEMQITANAITSHDQFLSSHEPEPPDPLIENPPENFSPTS
jgi:hypothetical protein